MTFIAQMGTGGADSPLVVDGYGADTADSRAREEKELQDKVDKEVQRCRGAEVPQHGRRETGL